YRVSPSLPTDYTLTCGRQVTPRPNMHTPTTITHSAVEWRRTYRPIRSRTYRSPSCSRPAQARLLNCLFAGVVFFNWAAKVAVCERLGCRKIDVFGRHMPSKQKGPRKEARREIRRPVWAEVSLSALEHNLEAIRKYVNPASEKRKTPRKILSIVKGNGYGHGGPQVAKALEIAGSDWFGVTCTGDGVAVREGGVRLPIVVLTGFVPSEEARLIEHGLTATIHRCDQLPLLERAAAR